ncbi:MAG TPA: hypothetical protein VGR43_08280 [Dehalococcoidia bacterium]|jgi:hypothetical protein|nr:hypothetical protein [Dehalococcoidia bacterium]
MRYALPLFVLIGAVALIACGDDGGGGQSPLDPGDFQAAVDNPLFPLEPGKAQVYEGEESDPDTGETVDIRVESSVLSETETIAGIEAIVVEVRDLEGGELVEMTRDYYAQDKDGTVYYFGEKVDDYEDGEVVGHGGQWTAGEGGAQAGIFMPADPKVGDEFEQERAPGVAEDVSKVVEVDQTVTTAAGTFSNCIKTEDRDPLSDVTEFKFYCPGEGLVREEFEDGFIELTNS